MDRYGTGGHVPSIFGPANTVTIRALHLDLAGGFSSVPDSLLCPSDHGDSSTPMFITSRIRCKVSRSRALLLFHHVEFFDLDTLIGLYQAVRLFRPSDDQPWTTAGIRCCRCTGVERFSISHPSHTVTHHLPTRTEDIPSLIKLYQLLSRRSSLHYPLRYLTDYVKCHHSVFETVSL